MSDYHVLMMRDKVDSVDVIFHKSVPAVPVGIRLEAEVP